MIGVLLINLGTPTSCNIKEVKKFLREFLSDPFVINVPWLIRKLLVNFFIIPFRSYQTTEAYKKIWTSDGSPLLSNTILIKEKLQKTLGEEFIVEIGMRYGRPNLENALNKLEHCAQIIILPLYPQFALATSTSTLNKLFNLLEKKLTTPSLSLLTNFYSRDFYINAYSKLISSYLSSHPFDHLLFSYHGIPLKQNYKISNCEANCQKGQLCATIHNSNRYCYRAQCFISSKLIAEKIGINPNQYSVAFQSRLGSIPWIKPYTDIHLEKLSKAGIKSLAIVCPSFICDCLETIEEIGMRLKEKWIKLGGKSFLLIPCLNDNMDWILSLSNLIKKNLSEERLNIH